MEHLAERLAEIPGVEAVTLGGSRAAGTARAHSDWDFGLYYRTTIDPDDVRALGFAGEVFAPGEWGTVPNGGAWLEIDGARVDLVYRDLATVEDVDGRCRGREVPRLPGSGLRRGRADVQLRGRARDQPAPRRFAAASRLPGGAARTRPEFWRRLAIGGLKFADAHARRDDAVACAGNLDGRRPRRPRTRGCARGASGT